MVRVNMKLFHILIYFSYLNQYGNSELRFCYNGPQRVNGDECPYGIYFNKPIESKCLYYQKGEKENPDKAPIISSDICCAETETMQDQNKTEAKIIQEIIYHPNICKPLVNMTSECYSECFQDVDPSLFSYGDNEMADYDFQGVDCSDEVTLEQTSVSEQLFDYLLFRQDSSPNLIQNRIHEVLDIGIMILLKHCGSGYIESEFLQQAHEALKFLQFSINKGKVMDMPHVEFDVIKQHLKQCLYSPSIRFKINGTMCSSKGKINWIDYKIQDRVEERRVKYVIQPKSFKFGKFDIFVEAMWDVLDFMHNVCFENFKNNLLHFHVLTEHVASIFKLKSISERWMCPTQLKNDNFWNNLAGVSNVTWTMRNLDFCAQASAAASVFKYRLDRVFETEDETHDSVLLNVTAKGWNGDEESYWKTYDKMGGVRNTLKTSSLAYCPSTRAESDEYKQGVVRNCL